MRHSTIHAPIRVICLAAVVVHRSQTGTRRPLLTWFCAAAVTLSVNVTAVAGIIDTSGAAIVIAPPSSVATGETESNTDVLVFAERTFEQLGVDLSVDVAVPSTVAAPEDLSLSSIPAGTVVDSYFLHADPVTSDPVAEFSGSITFDSEVIGLIVQSDSHDASDSLLGALGTAYGQSPNRQLELIPSSTVGDEITLSRDRRTVTFLFKATLFPDQVRVVTASGRAAETVFRRGDCNADGKLDISDPLANLSFQFVGTFDPPCRDALDFDDSGKLDITDPIANLTHQFLGGPPPAAPGKVICGADPTVDDLGCENLAACKG